MTSTISQALHLQSKACLGLGSPFSAGLLEHAAADVAAGGPTSVLFAPFAALDLRGLMAAAVPLRLLGALHDLVLSGEVPALAAAYPLPDKPFDPDSAWVEARRAIAAAPGRIAAFMTHEPQTNEVRRSACLLGGFLAVAERTGLPLRTYEIAASAGLNLSWDRYRYDLAGAPWGPPDSPVRLPTAWRGPLPPLDAHVRVLARAACDRRPVDLSDPVQRRRLLAYVWPDQFERLGRIAAAIDLAIAEGVVVEAADAVDWTARNVRPEPGVAVIAYHSVFWQYMPPESQSNLLKTFENISLNATDDAPFAWLRMEPPPDDMAAMEVRLTLWPNGTEQLLARVHPHGASVDWLG